MIDLLKMHRNTQLSTRTSRSAGDVMVIESELRQKIAEVVVGSLPINGLYDGASGSVALGVSVPDCLASSKLNGTLVSTSFSSFQ